MSKVKIQSVDLLDYLGPPPEVLRVEEPEFDSLLNLSKPVVPLPIFGAVSRVTPACTLILRWLCPVVLYSFLLGTMLVNLKLLRFSNHRKVVMRVTQVICQALGQTCNQVIDLCKSLYYILSCNDVKHICNSEKYTGKSQFLCELVLSRNK